MLTFNKKLVLIGGVTTLLGGYIVYKNINTLKLKTNVIFVEYGDAINNDVILSGLLGKNTNNNDIFLSYDIPKDYNNEKYYKVGSYTGTIKSNKTEKNFQIVIKDTKAPKFISYAAKIINDVGNIPKYDKYFKVSDLSGATLVIDDSKVDYLKEGNYESYAIAKDNNGLISFKMFNVIVSDK